MSSYFGECRVCKKTKSLIDKTLCGGCYQSERVVSLNVHEKNFKITIPKGADKKEFKDLIYYRREEIKREILRDIFSNPRKWLNKK